MLKESVQKKLWREKKGKLEIKVGIQFYYDSFNPIRLSIYRFSTAVQFHTLTLVLSLINLTVSSPLHNYKSS